MCGICLCLLVAAALCLESPAPLPLPTPSSATHAAHPAGTPWMLPWEKRQLQGGDLRWWEKVYWGVFVVGIALILFNRIEWEKAPDPVRLRCARCACCALRAVGVAAISPSCVAGCMSGARPLVCSPPPAPSSCSPCSCCHPIAGDRGAQEAAGGRAAGGGAAGAGREECAGALGHRRPLSGHDPTGARACLLACVVGRLWACRLVAADSQIPAAA